MQMGARVAIDYNRSKEKAEALASVYPETKSETFHANLEIASEVEALFKNVERSFERIDVILLNAGIYVEHPIHHTLDDWLEVWKQTLAVNLDAVGILTKLGIDHFRSQGGGRFIYIGSRAAFRGETEEFLAYAASKGGLTSLARSVARSFGKDDITSFVLAPGFTRTAMAETFIVKYGEDRILKELSLNKLTEPEHIAPLAALISSGLMDHATGSTIDINAGSYLR
jgi:NAD(P)-dependent dehydrogenase (short-subunit alcohol dehydrogenase family)